jgi:Tfp pilus assembly protein PilW
MRNQRGFALIEIVIYAGIVGAIMISMVLITKVMYETRARVRTTVLLQENLRFAMARITASLRRASAVTEPAGSGPTLSLTMEEATDDPTVVTLTDGVIFMSEGASSSVALTSSQVEITDFMFTRSTSTIPIVRVDITGRIRGADGPYQSEQSISNSATIRR